MAGRAGSIEIVFNPSVDFCFWVLSYQGIRAGCLGSSRESSDSNSGSALGVDDWHQWVIRVARNDPKQRHGGRMDVATPADFALLRRDQPHLVELWQEYRAKVAHRTQGLSPRASRLISAIGARHLLPRTGEDVLIVLGGSDNGCVYSPSAGVIIVGLGPDPQSDQQVIADALRLLAA